MTYAQKVVSINKTLDKHPGCYSPNLVGGTLSHKVIDDTLGRSRKIV